MEEIKRLEVGKILTKTFLIYRVGFKQFIGLSAMALILTVCLTVFQAALGHALALLLLALVLIIVSVYINIRVNVSIVKLAGSLAQGVRMTFKESFQSSKGYAGTYFAVALMYCFITLIPMIGMIVSFVLVKNMILKCVLMMVFGAPFLFLYTRYYMAIPSALLSERMNGEFQSSKRLVKGDFWPVLIIVVLTCGIFVLIEQFLEIRTGSVGSGLWPLTPADVLVYAIQVITAPIGIIAAVLMYLDLNERKAVDTLVGRTGGQGAHSEDTAPPEQIN